MRIGWCTLLFFLLNQAFGQAQNIDSIPTRHVKEVAIPGTRTRTTLDQIAARFTPDLSRILAQSSDIYLRQYGPSGASSISLNGLGAAQTSLEWNGVPLNSPLLGQADANQFAAGGSSISRESCTAFSGTQAAALSLITTKPDTGKTIALGGQIGLYGLINTQAGLGIRQRRWAASSRFQWNEAQNNFSVEDPTRGRARFRLPNGRSFRRQAEGHVWYAGSMLSTEIHAFTALWGRHLAPSTQSLEQRTNEAMNGQNSAVTVSEIYDKGLDSARASYVLTAEQYQYSFPAGQPPPERFAFTRQQARGAYFRRWRIARGGVQYEAVQERTPDLESVGRRERYMHYLTPSLTLVGQQLDAGAILFQQKLYFSPKLLLQRWGFSILARRTFRAPTFNDLYYPIYGRADLKPEQSAHLEGGFSKTLFLSENWDIGISEAAGLYRFTNYIQWTPIANQYQPTNLINISNYYCNTKLVIIININNVKLVISNSLSISKVGNANGFLDWPAEQLIYTPVYQNSRSTSLFTGGWEFSLTGKHTGRRYYTSQNSISNSLAPFYLANARVAHTARIRSVNLTGFGTFGNLLGTEYAYIQDYPMPRYEFSIGIQIELRR